jgi:hypothetical protein
MYRPPARGRERVKPLREAIDLLEDEHGIVADE